MDMVSTEQINQLLNRNCEYASSFYNKNMHGQIGFAPSHINEVKNFPQRRKHKVIYTSPLWRRDSTHRLQRKPVRESTSSESLINISNQESLTPDDDNCTFNPTGLNLSDIDNNCTPHWKKIKYRRSRQLRKDFIPVRNGKIFNSTMKNCSYQVAAETSKKLNPLFEKEKTNLINFQRNHTAQLKISNSWIDWTPFWSRDCTSKRLDRRHYISDFFNI